MRTSACLLSIILALPAVSQVREDVSVELVEVPVYVTSSDGAAIRGLTRENFALRVNGKPQPIEYFEAVDFARVVEKGMPASARAPRERRLYLLLFDGAYTMAPKVVRAQRAAEYAIDRSDPETDLFSVATYTSSKGIQFATPFVSDRAAIRRALHTLAAPTDPLGLAIAAVDREKWLTAEGADQFALEGEMASAIKGGAAFQDLIADQARHRVEDMLDDFRDLAHRLAGLEGQKHVLYFSSGFSAALIHGGAATAASPLSGGGFDAHAIGTYERLCAAFAAAGVFVDPVDIEGIRHQNTKIAPFNSNEGLQLMSDGTGGYYVHGRNDFGAAVNEMLDAQKNVYVLAFNRRNNRSGTITLKVTGVPTGTRVSYRQGFGKAEASTDVDPLRMADILLHDVPQTALTLGLDATRNALHLTAARSEILAQASANARLDALFYVFDDNGSPIFGSEQRATVEKSGGGIQLEQSLHLAPGHYTAKVIARIEGTASLGFARKEFTVE